MEKLDILAIAAHPDDVELSSAGTLISHINRGYKAGVIDLTRGEMGTRGSAAERDAEAAAASRIMGLTVRENLDLPDAFFDNSKESQVTVIKAIRKYQPEIVIANAPYDRHPDHGRAAALVEEAFFKAGLAKISTEDDEGIQQAWRPKKLYHMIQSVSLQPDFIVDVSDSHDQKIEAIKAYKSQFFDPNSSEPETYISRPGFLRMIEARATEFGHRIQVPYGEGFIQKQFMGVRSLFDFV